MKFSRLLIGASALALISGAAQAQVSAALGDADNDTTVNELQTGFQWANETDFSASVDTDLGLLVNTVNNIAGGTNVQIEINLSGPVEFDGQVPDSALVVGADGTGTNTGFTLVGTGADGSQSVTFQYEIAAAPGETSIGFQLPVSFTGCGSVDVDIQLRTDLGVLIQGGNASVPAPGGQTSLFECGGSAFQVAFASDESTEDTVIENDAAFTLLGDALVNNFENASTGVIGTVSGSIDTSLIRDIVSHAPVAVAAGDIDAVSFEVLFADDAAMTDVDLLTSATACSQGAGGVWACALSEADSETLIGGGSEDIQITVDGTTAISRQAVSAQNELTEFDSGLNLIASESDTSGGPLDGLQWVGVTCGVFDFVASSGNIVGRNDVVRITGLPSGDVDFAMSLMNANDTAFNGDFHGTLADRDGDRRINSTTMTNVAGGDFGTADVLFHFFVDDSNDVSTPTDATGTAPDLPFGSGVDCDRLVTDQNGSIASYGDGANQDGAGDAIYSDGVSQADTPVQN